MSVGLRAAVAVTLLAGFYVLALGTVAGLCVGGVLLVWEYGIRPGTVQLLVAFVAAAGAIVLGLFKAMKRPQMEPHGVRLYESNQPHFWGLVRDLADRVGTRAPDEIWLVPDVNAAVAENSRMLGLIGGRRYMLVGLPLVLALTTDQLRAVLGHELGHYSHSHTRLGAINYRGRTAILETMGQLKRTSPIRWVFGLYARVYFLVERAVSRRQEFEADRAAGAIAGRHAAQTALHEIEVLAAAWGFYMQQYVMQGTDHGLAPTGVFPGFSWFLSGRQEELNQLRHQRLPGGTSRWDSHPSTPDRIAALASAPDLGVYNDQRPAWQALVDVPGLTREVERQCIDFGDRKQLEWPEYTSRSFLAQQQELADGAFRALSRVTGRTPESFETILQAYESGRFGPFWEQMLQANTPQGGVAAMVAVAAIKGGVVRVEHRWDGPARLLARNGAEFDPGKIVLPLWEDGTAGAARVRDALRHFGIDMRYAVPQQLRRDAGSAEVIGALANVKVDGAEMDVILTDQGLVLVPAPKGSSDKGEQRVVALLQERPVRELAAAPSNRWIPYEEISAAEVHKRVPVQASLRLHDGGTVQLKESWTGDEIGKSRDMLLEVLAAFNGNSGGR